MDNNLNTIQQKHIKMDEKNTIFYNPIFPVMIAYSNLNLPVEEMASDICNLASDTRNYEGGYTTFHSNINIDHLRGIPELKKAIYNTAISYTQEFKILVNSNKIILQLWASVIRKEGHHNIHHHPRSVYSGTFYVDVNEHSAPLVLLNPTMLLRMHDPTPASSEDEGPFTSNSMQIIPKNNLLVLWPSWMLHHVPVHLDSKPRVSISFNVDFINLNIL